MRDARWRPKNWETTTAKVVTRDVETSAICLKMIVLYLCVSGETGHYMIAVVIWSGIGLLSQVIFQSILLSKASNENPYGTFLKNCKLTLLCFIVKTNIYLNNYMRCHSISIMWIFCLGSTTESVLRQLGLQRYLSIFYLTLQVCDIKNKKYRGNNLYVRINENFT